MKFRTKSKEYATANSTPFKLFFIPISNSNTTLDSCRLPISLTNSIIYLRSWQPVLRLVSSRHRLR